MATDGAVRPGDVHVFKPGHAIAIGVGIWAARQGGKIQIHMTGPMNMHRTVTNSTASERYHRDLRRILVDNDAWPFGDEGAETEG